MEDRNNKLPASQRRGRPSDGPSRICTYCKKKEPPNARSEQTLKRCSRCRTSLYCSRACQRADWKRGHQRTCISGAIMARNSCYLDGLQSEDMAMDQLIDAYRLRIEDEKMYCGRLRGRYDSTISTSTSTSAVATSSEGSNSQALQSAFRDFQAFLDLAEAESRSNTSDHRNDDHEGGGDSSSPSSSTTVETETDTSSSSSPPSSVVPITNNTTKEKDTTILPRWWNAEKRALCEARALGKCSETWPSLIHPAGKAEILDHYQDSLMPMKLRMVAERVYGSDVMGQSRP